MSFLITYKRLFEVEIFHDYFLYQEECPYYALKEKNRTILFDKYDLRQIFEIKPTPFSQRIMQGQSMVFKATSRGFMVGIKVDSTGNAPAIDIAKFFKLSFLIKVRNRFFPNFSSLRLRGNPEMRYYFSNLSQNDQEGNALLSLKIEDYETSHSYSVGDLVIDPDQENRLLEALRDQPESPGSGDWAEIVPDTENESCEAVAFDAAVAYSKGDLVLNDFKLYEALKDNPGDLSDPEEWVLIPYQQYIGYQDQLNFRPSAFNVELPAPGFPEITIQLLRYEGEGEGGAPPSETVIYSRTEEVEETGDLLQTIITRFQGVEPGRYRLRVLFQSTEIETPQSGPFYLDVDRGLQEAFGMIEVIHQKDLEAFRILENDGSLRQEKGKTKYPIFQLRIKNRQTKWRYIFNSELATLEGKEGEAIFDQENKNSYVTKSHKPLTNGRLPFESRYEKEGTGILVPLNLPSPAVELVKPQLIQDPDTNQRQVENIFSEIYLDI